MNRRRARRRRIIALVHALLLLASVVAVSGAEGGAGVLVLHRVRLTPLLSAVRRGRGLVRVGVVLLVVAVLAVLAVGHPPGAVHGLDAALSAATGVYAADSLIC